MATAVTSSITDIGEEVNYQLYRGLLSTARKRLVYFNGSLPGELMGKGSTRSVMWERIENLAIGSAALAENIANSAWLNGRSLVQPTKSTVAATAAKYGKAIQINEEVDLLQMNVNSMRLMETLGANAGEELNDLMIDVYQAVTAASVRNGTNAATITAITAAITANDIKWATNFVNRNSGQKFTPLGFGSTNIGTSPIRDAYYGTCHPDVEEDIRGLTGFVGVESYGGYTQTLPGEFGTVNGVRWCTSELSGVIAADSGGATTSTGLRYTSTKTGIDLYDSFVYGKEAIGTIGLNTTFGTDITKMYDTKLGPVQLIHQPVGSAGPGDPFREFGSIAWKAWWTAAILNGNWLTRIRTGASKLT